MSFIYNIFGVAWVELTSRDYRLCPISLDPFIVQSDIQYKTTSWTDRSLG